METNRPDFYNNAEHRRHVISARAREREQMHNKRVQNLAKLISRTGNEAQYHHGQTRGKFSTLNFFRPNQFIIILDFNSLFVLLCRAKKDIHNVPNERTNHETLQASSRSDE